MDGNETEMWSIQGTEPVLGAHAGAVVLSNVHPPKRCEGSPCSLHSPSDHHMRGWPLYFRSDRGGLMERLCPHGIGHPDPDDLAYHARMVQFCEGLEDPAFEEIKNAHNGMNVHGCDGCCRPPLT